VIATILAILGIWLLLFLAFLGLWILVRAERSKTRERMRQALQRAAFEDARRREDAQRRAEVGR
jgi:flagellar biosynthesis/type III secretory pathway M-ring protein FliF/YscJ